MEDPGGMDVPSHSEYLAEETSAGCSGRILEDSKMLTGCFLRCTWDKAEKK